MPKRRDENQTAFDGLQEILRRDAERDGLPVEPKPKPEGAQRYSPAEWVDCIKTPIHGNPDMSKVRTSHIERQNLTVRMSMRRMTRLTNAFSKKWENLKHSYALHFGYYDFCKVHSSLRVTPSMEAGITDHVWGLSELISGH